jgi:hypothetical protein
MRRVIDVVFDGEVLRPDEPLDLERNRRYRVVIDQDEPEDEVPPGPGMLDDIVALAQPFGISDLAAQFEHYMYGHPKQ